ncbi:MAG: hypothetical protein QXK06_04805 [Candidatus Diapherotrites archaeon]
MQSSASELKQYFSSELEPKAFLSEAESSSYGWYQYRVVKNVLRDDFGLQVQGEDYKDDAKIAEGFFAKECNNLELEKCEPYTVLMPYCMSKYAYFVKERGNTDGLKTELFAKETFASAMQYWEQQIESKKVLEENDLPAVLGITICQLVYGELGTTYNPKLFEKVLAINIEYSSQTGKALESMKKKATILRLLLQSVPAGKPKNTEAVPIFCKSFESMAKKEKGNVCAAYNFYLLKQFCGQESPINSSEDYLLASRFFKERYSRLDEVMCQIGLLNYAEPSPRGRIPIGRPEQ